MLPDGGIIVMHDMQHIKMGDLADQVNFDFHIQCI